MNKVSSKFKAPEALELAGRREWLSLEKCLKKVFRPVTKRELAVTDRLFKLLEKRATPIRMKRLARHYGITEERLRLAHQQTGARYDIGLMVKQMFWVLGFDKNFQL